MCLWPTNSGTSDVLVFVATIIRYILLVRCFFVLEKRVDIGGQLNTKSNSQVINLERFYQSHK